MSKISSKELVHEEDLDEAIENDTRGNIDIYRDAQSDGEVRRKTGTGNGVNEHQALHAHR